MPTGSGTGPCDPPYIVNGGPMSWGLRSNRLGYRDYDVTFRVKVDPALDGPYCAFNCPGLPEAGDIWDLESCVDGAAFFTKEREVKQVGPTWDNQYFDVRCVATTSPVSDCYTDNYDDPLAIPDRVRIQTVTYSHEARFDRFGDPFVNSAWEQYRGKQVEFDAHRIRIYIEQNHDDLDETVVESLMHTLNDMTLWGFPPRTVKLSEFDAEPKYYRDCQKYWVRKFIFDVAFDFDRCLLDEGTKVLRGKWDTNPTSPTYGQYVLGKMIDPGTLELVDVTPDDPRHFIRYKDWHGENTRVILNGRGKPYDPEQITPGTDDDVIGQNCFEYYEEGNLLLLDIPISLG